MATAVSLLGRDPVGLRFTVHNCADKRMAAVKFTEIKGGLFDLAFRQLPRDLCQKLETALDLGGIYVMPFDLGSDYLGAIILCCDRREGLLNRVSVEHLVNFAGLVLKRKRMEETLRDSGAAPQKDR